MQRLAAEAGQASQPDRALRLSDSVHSALLAGLQYNLRSGSVEWAYRSLEIWSRLGLALPADLAAAEVVVEQSARAATHNATRYIAGLFAETGWELGPAEAALR